MKYLIDLSCPTDVLLFKGLKEELEERGHNVFLMSRGYIGLDYITQLASSMGLEVKIIGLHGGESLYGKLVAGAERTQLLARHIRDLGIDGVISNSNPETCRVGFGLGLKVFTWNDSPDLQVAQTSLTAPLSTWIFTPWIVPKEAFVEIGVPEEKIYQYKALFPMAWLPTMKVNTVIVEELGLDPAKTLVTFRESETKAAYLERGDVAVGAVKILASKHPEWQFACRPRYSYPELAEKMEEIASNVHIFTEPVDLQSLLACSDLFIGGGGTMSIEAAYYGTPVISARAKTTYYEKFLISHGLVHRTVFPQSAVKLAERFIKSALLHESLRVWVPERTPRLFAEMNYPLLEIVSILEDSL